MSGFCAVPRMNGRSGDRDRARCARTSSSEISARTSSSSSISIVWSSCEVRKPSKKCTNGTRVSSVAAWATSARSWASWTDAAESSAKPVWRTAITSEWSPKIDSPCAASERAATCITAEVSSPAILYMFGIISSRPWEAVNVVAKRAALERAVQRAGGAAFALHLHHRGDRPPQVRPPLARPLVRQLGHRRGRRDGEDAAHLAAPEGDRRGRFVAVDGGAHHGPVPGSGGATNA